MNQLSTVEPNELQRWIVAWLASELELSPDEIATSENLLIYGVDSVNAMMLVGDLEDHLGIRLPSTLVWDFPTVDGLVDTLSSERFEQLPRSATGASPVREGNPGIQNMEIAEAKLLLEKLDQLSDSEVEALLERLSKEDLS